MADVQNQAAISDDQELAKVLQGMQQQTRSMATHDPQTAKTDTRTGMQYEETAAPAAKDATAPGPDLTVSQAPISAVPEAAEEPSAPEKKETAAVTNEPAPVSPTVVHATTAATPALESLKKEALEELRPLVTKLDLPAKEKFDTMLLIIRSTDDQELLQPAHEAAKAIIDDIERAEALLDIVKEIDYFAASAQAK